jgi:glycosyltransferase involved in cell wall biosynthesis
MKLLLISEFYSPRIGGAETVVRMIGEHFARLGWEVHVVTGGREESWEEINGVKVHRVPVSGNLVKGIKGDIEQLKTRIRQLQPDVTFVYAMQTWGSDLFVGDSDFLKNSTRLVVAPCGLSALSSIARRIAYWRYLRTIKLTASRFDHYVFHTRQGNDFKYLANAVHDNYSIIPNAVPSDVLRWSRESAVEYLKQKGLADLLDHKIVLNVSNHYRIKGHRRLMRIFDSAFPEDCRLVIAGTIPEGGQGCYKECARTVAVSRNKILIDGSDRFTVLSLYKIARLFLLSSSVEYFPLVLLEAQGSRLPFLSMPVGNASELEGGIVLSPKKITKTVVSNLLGNEAVLQSVAERGYRQATESCPEARVMQEYEKLFTGMLV